MNPQSEPLPPAAPVQSQHRRSTPDAGPAVKRKTPKTPAELAAEPLVERYLRHCRGLLAVIVAVIGLSILGGVITAIAVAVSHSQSTGCASLGGNDPSC
jgi:hypothetical protein